jgi:hypothetical protein
MLMTSESTANMFDRRTKVAPILSDILVFTSSPGERVEFLVFT